MGYSVSPRSSIWRVLFIFVLLIVLAGHVAGQGLPKLPGNNDAAATTSASDTVSATDSASSSSTSGTETSASTTTGSATTTSSDTPGLTGAPKLAGDNYPPPTVPPTADAPYMQKSNLPEGTVFIAVGAVLAFIGLIVLAWRGLVAWSLQRSVRKAAIAQSARYRAVNNPGGGKGVLQKDAPFSSAPPVSMQNLDHLAGRKRSAAGASGQQDRSSLFFSPTAGANLQQQRPNSVRPSGGYLPAGYYASGAASAAAGAPSTYIGSRGRDSSIPRPMSQYSSLPPSRHHSPARSASRPRTDRVESFFGGGDGATGMPVGASSVLSSPQSRRGTAANLLLSPDAGSYSPGGAHDSHPQRSRAPSAYLEDLFESGVGSSSPSKSSNNNNNNSNNDNNNNYNSTLSNQAIAEQQKSQHDQHNQLIIADDLARVEQRRQERHADRRERREEQKNVSTADTRESRRQERREERRRKSASRTDRRRQDQ